MANKRFGYFILAAFLTATALLLVIQYNFSDNMSTMLSGNKKLLKELRASNHLREIDRDILGVESRIRAAIATDDTSHLEGVDTKIAAVMAYLDSMDTDDTDQVTRQHLKRLSELSADKIRIKNSLMKRYFRVGNMNDTTFIANPGARKISDEITGVTQTIYKSRQQKMVQLSQSVINGSKKARLYGNILIAFMFVSGAALCWFIYSQFNQQNTLIVKLDASERTSREALQIKENFLANMSHEIRTPLNAILGFTNLLKRREGNSGSAEFIDAIEKAGENLMAIINDILDLSKIEAGMMRIVSAPFSVRGLTHSIETLFKEKVREKGLTLKSTVADDVPDTLIGDATRLTQILVNLIGNALKFSDKGAIEVGFFKQSVTNGIINLGVRVKDTGIGISEEKLERIFERFNQAEDSITRNYGGTGLGLSIVKTLIQLQNGTIEVSSEPGRGTEFVFTIPYTVADEQITHDHHLNTEALKSIVTTSLKILVVDDNVMNQSLMKHVLMQWGASFSIVSNGVEAINELKAAAFDIVLMDIQMPQMDGYTATRHIRDELKTDIPIIAMTAHAMAGEREKCLSHGMNEYLSKPINEDLLFEMIGKFVGAKTTKPLAASPGLTKEDNKLIDLTYMKDISKGNVAYERVVTEQFIVSIPQDIAGLMDAFEKGDAAQLNRIAHNMKTSVAIMGLLPKLETRLDELEHTREITAALAPILDEVKTICMAAVQEAKDFNLTLISN